MRHPNVGGVDWGDLAHLRGDFDLGWNGTGVIRSSLHISDDEIVIKEEMPGDIVDTIIGEVAAMSALAKTRRPGGELIGKLPLPIWHAWRKQWESGPKLQGMLWRAFFTTKFMDSDFNKFRVRKN